MKTLSIKNGFCDTVTITIIAARGLDSEKKWKNNI